MKEYISATKIWELVTVDFLTLQEIADYHGVSRQLLSNRLKEAGYTIRKAPYKGRDIPSLTQPTLLKQHLSSSKNWLDAGEKLGVTDKVIKNWAAYHGIEHEYCYKGSNAPAWKGGRFTDKETGYIWINSHESGYADWNPQWGHHSVFEHKALLEMKVLGFPTPDGYVIHHINENRADNDIKNLVLLTEGEHIHIHHVIKEAKECTQGDRQWRSVLLGYINTCIRAIHDSHVRRFQMIHLLNSEGSLDEMATLSKDQSEKDWHDRDRKNWRNLWEECG